MNCPFCSETIIRDQQVYTKGCWRVFYNFKPVLKGHVLIVSKRHVELCKDLNADEQASLVGQIIDVQRMLTRAYGATGFCVVMQDGVSAGQSVNHLHVHIVPRVDGDMHKGEFYQSLLVDSTRRHPISAEEMQERVKELQVVVHM
ncbi:HIT domain-containing protein [Candidatus Woesearchaeota archaeon]|nr:HIT domain-containing protein [Candidatus Woesearchaeota archaeon]